MGEDDFMGYPTVKRSLIHSHFHGTSLTSINCALKYEAVAECGHMKKMMEGKYSIQFNSNVDEMVGG